MDNSTTIQLAKEAGRQDTVQWKLWAAVCATIRGHQAAELAGRVGEEARLGHTESVPELEAGVDRDDILEEGIPAQATAAAS